MPQWSKAERWRKLQEAIEWKYSDDLFVVVAHKVIENLPEPERSTMIRFYLEGDTQDTSSPQDTRFYHLLQSGRSSFKAIMNMIENDDTNDLVIRLIGESNGWKSKQQRD